MMEKVLATNMMTPAKLAGVNHANTDLTQKTCLFAYSEDCDHTNDTIH